jgi:hypothetical protein
LQDVRWAAWVALPWLFSPLSAGAREVAVRAEAGYALQWSGGAAHHGATAEASGTAAVNDFFLVGGGVRGLVLASSAGTTTGVLPTLTALFRLDVIEWVPVVALDVGSLLRFASQGSAADLAVAFGLGVDYLLSRDWSVGGIARYHLVVTDIASTRALVTVSFRIAFRWE